MTKKISLIGLLCMTLLVSCASPRTNERIPTNADDGIANDESVMDIYGNSDHFIKITPSADNTAVNFKNCPIPLVDEKKCTAIGNQQYYLKVDLEKLHKHIVKNAVGKFAVIVGATVASGYLVGKDPTIGRGSANLVSTAKNFLESTFHTVKQVSAATGGAVISTIILNPSKSLSQEKLTRAEYITGSKDLVTKADVKDLVKALNDALALIDQGRL